MSEKILALAAELGETEPSELLGALCEAAERELTGRLRQGVSVENCGKSFPLAAAWLALAGLQDAKEDGVKSFSAGEVSIQRGEGDARQKALRRQALLVMRPFLRDERFIFRGVRG